MKEYLILKNGDKVTKSTVKNKYNIKPKDLNNYHVIDFSKLTNEPFWRNNAVKAYCLSGCFGPIQDETEFWIGLFDDGHVEINYSSYGGMCGYEFDEFLSLDDVDNKDDYHMHEKALVSINYLIDNKIIAPKENEKC